MPAYFTAYTPLQVTDFDYEAFFESFEDHFAHLSFYREWKEYWMDIFNEIDKLLLDYMREFPNSNPVLQRLKHGVVPYANDYEMYVYTQPTAGGNFYLHFDVEKMKHFQKEQRLEKMTLSADDLYVDPTTPVVKEQEKDESLPFFVRMYGTPKPFICVDGNKRIQARLSKGQNTFKGYLFGDKDVMDMFFGSDLYYFLFLKEYWLMIEKQKDRNAKEQDILQMTQMYHQT